MNYVFRSIAGSEDQSRASGGARDEVIDASASRLTAISLAFFSDSFRPSAANSTESDWMHSMRKNTEYGELPPHNCNFLTHFRSYVITHLWPVAWLAAHASHFLEAACRSSDTFAAACAPGHSAPEAQTSHSKSGDFRKYENGMIQNKRE
jgi:hypothetical protein